MNSPQEEGGKQDSHCADHSNFLLEIVPKLPLETRWPPFPLRQYGSFWIIEATLQVGIPTSKLFKSRSTDVFLASVPKSGTTWLMALAFATVNRTTYSPFPGDGSACHPLHHRNPHDCIPFFEPISRDSPWLLHELETLPSPRVLATHLPYSLLPDNIKDEGSGSRIVYIARDPKDVLVSSWIFFRKAAMAMGVIVDDESFNFQEAFELFCEGRSSCGPHWRHVLEYWDESVKRPDKVLFIKYEEMLLDPKTNLKKLARFMGCEFSQQEDDEGVVDAIVELCSLNTLKNMEVNKDGKTKMKNIKNDIYFRKGVAGDWSNYMTPGMAQKLDNIVRDGLQGSGFTFF